MDSYNNRPFYDSIEKNKKRSLFELDLSKSKSSENCLNDNNLDSQYNFNVKFEPDCDSNCDDFYFGSNEYLVSKKMCFVRDKVLMSHEAMLKLLCPCELFDIFKDKSELNSTENSLGIDVLYTQPGIYFPLTKDNVVFGKLFIIFINLQLLCKYLYFKF